jgi:hypothetical protein
LNTALCPYYLKILRNLIDFFSLKTTSSICTANRINDWGNNYSLWREVMRKAIFNGRERRSYVRVDRELPIRYRIKGHPSGQIYTGATKNISQGGLCVEIIRHQDELIETLSSIKKQPFLEVELTLPGRNGQPGPQTDWITGRVDWLRNPTAKNPVSLIGLGFVDLHEEVRRKIYDFVLGVYLKGYQPELRVRPPVYAVR